MSEKTEMTDELERLKAMNAELAEALEPFGKAADLIESNSPNLSDEVGLWVRHQTSIGTQGIFLGDVRHARAVLARYKEMVE